MIWKQIKNNKMNLRSWRFHVITCASFLFSKHFNVSGFRGSESVKLDTMLRVISLWRYSTTQANTKGKRIPYINRFSFSVHSHNSLIYRSITIEGPLQNIFFNMRRTTTFLASHLLHFWRAIWSPLQILHP